MKLIHSEIENYQNKVVRLEFELNNKQVVEIVTKRRNRDEEPYYISINFYKVTSKKDEVERINKGNYTKQFKNIAMDLTPAQKELAKEILSLIRR